MNKAEPERPDQARNSKARLEAAARELAALAGEQAAVEMEAAVARLKARARPPGHAAADSEAPPPRTPRWLWSNRPRTDKLYRIPRGTGEAKLFGVCAGIANYCGMETLVVRLALVALCFLTNFVPLLGYLAAALIMDTEPAAATQARHAKRHRRDRRPKRGKRRAPSPPPPKFTAVRRSYDDLERRLQRLERFVTSKRYHLHRELATALGADNGKGDAGGAPPSSDRVRDK